MRGSQNEINLATFLKTIFTFAILFPWKLNDLLTTYLTMLYSGNTYRIAPDMRFSIYYLTLFVVVGGGNEVEDEG
jgi:hypothetical protein